MPEICTAIGQQAFLDCSNLREANFAPGLELGPMAFADTPLQQ